MPKLTIRTSGMSALLVAALGGTLLGCSSTDRANFAKGFCDAAKGRCEVARAATGRTADEPPDMQDVFTPIEQMVCLATPGCMNIRLMLHRIKQDQQRNAALQQPQAARPATEVSIKAQRIERVAPQWTPLLFPRGCADSLNAVALPYTHLKPRFQAQWIRAIQNGLAGFNRNIPNKTVGAELPTDRSTFDVNGTAHQLLTCSYQGPLQTVREQSHHPTERWVFWKGTAPSLRACDIQVIEQDDRGLLLADIALPHCPETAGEARRLVSIRVEAE